MPDGSVDSARGVEAAAPTLRVVALGDNVVDVYRNRGVTYPGGNAVNVAVNAARLGHAASYFGAFADDAYGLFLRGFLAREGVDVTGCPVVPHTTTKRCVEDVVDGERYFVRVEDAGWVGPLAAGDLAAEARSRVATADVVLTSVNAKMSGQLDLLAQARGLVAYDLGEKAKYRTSDLLAGLARVADVVQLSAGDASEEELAATVAALADDVLVVVTRGSDPTLLAWPDGRVEVACEAVTPRDTMGAGDAYLTALALGLAERGWRSDRTLMADDLRRIAERAATWAARACLTDGGFESPYEGPLAVVFDMDGVLVASEVEWARLFERILADHGLPLAADARRDLYGCSDEHENEVLAGLLGISEAEAAELKAAYVARHPIDYAAIAIEGVADAPRRLRELGLRLAIATSSPAVDAERMIAECGLAGLFDAVVTADDVVQTKPDPAIYLRAAELLGVFAARCVAVDDSPYGIESARCAGMYAIHFDRGGDTPPVGERAHAVCASHGAVLTTVEDLIKNGSMS